MFVKLIHQSLMFIYYLSHIKITYWIVSDCICHESGRWVVEAQWSEIEKGGSSYIDNHR